LFFFTKKDILLLFCLTMLPDILRLLQCGGGAHPLSANGFMPHGFCFLWRPDVLWLHVLSDGTIAAAYYCIPLVLMFFIRRRRDLPFPAIFWMFSAFILLCGTTHVMSIWVLWHPNYFIEGWIKAATALVSVATAIMLIYDLPKALALVSAAQLAAENVQLTARAEHSEARERLTVGAIMDNVFDGIITIGDDGRIISFNGACERLFGYEAAEVLGQPASILVPPDGYDEQRRRFAQYAQDAAAGQRSGEARELTCVRKDGTRFALESMVSSFTLGGKSYVTGCVRDITDRKAAAAERDLLLARLTDSNAELERFAYVASHDMQEPVRMMLSFSQLLQLEYDGALNADGREYLEIIASSALRMRNMIRDLLDYAKLEGDSRVFGPVDMRCKWDMAADNLQHLIAETKAVITCDDLPEPHGSAVQVMRLLQNLMLNALKYQPPGQVPHVHLGVLADQDGPVFYVRDNGIGIKAEFLDQIFEPFRRLHTWQAIPGSGLGLSICRKIVERHGGKIWAVSSPGEGTTVYFRLG